MLESISNFLLEKEVAVIHLFIVAILSPLIYWFLKVLSIAILKGIKKIVNPFYEYIARINSFRKRKITLRDYKNILIRLKHGGKLKWYEKEAFYEAKKQNEEMLKEMAKSLSLDFERVPERLNLTMPQIPQDKDFPNRPDGEDA